MNAWQRLARAVVIGCLSAHAHFAMAQDDASIYGTHSVVFQPVQSGGVLHSCTLVYRAVQADYAYRNGSPIVIVGNIGVHQQDANMILVLKIGVKDLDVPNAPFTRPYFGYLQTANATTAKGRSDAHDGDEGFRLIAVGLDDVSIKLIFEMLDAGKVIIGFNRNKNGIDVLVPIDLKVFDAEPLPPQSFRRKRSDEANTQFLGCFKEILQQGISKLPK